MSDNFLSDWKARKHEGELIVKFFKRKFLVRATDVGIFDLFLCLLPWVLWKHAIFVEGRSRTERTSFLTFSFVTLFAHFPLPIEQKKRIVAQDDGEEITGGLATQSETQTIAQISWFNLVYRARNCAKQVDGHWIARFERKRAFFGMHRSLAHGVDGLCKVIENSITIAVLDQCRPDLGISRKIAGRIRKSGVVLEPDSHFAEVRIENVLSIVLKFIISWARSSSPCWIPADPHWWISSQMGIHGLSGRNHVSRHWVTERQRSILVKLQRPDFRVDRWAKWLEAFGNTSEFYMIKHRRHHILPLLNVDHGFGCDHGKKNYWRIQGFWQVSDAERSAHPDGENSMNLSCSRSLVFADWKDMKGQIVGGIGKKESGHDFDGPWVNFRETSNRHNAKRWFSPQ
jgi:hypothetical protein